jgi:hypothetical protein
MPSRKKSSKAVSFNAVDVANIAKANPYIQRLIDDAKLRDHVRHAIDSGRSAYDRVSNGKAPAKAVLQDKKLQRDLRDTFEHAREAFGTLQEAPRKQARKGMRLGRKLMVVAVGGVLAVAVSEKLRSKVLDTLFGAEEEFQYTPPATTPAPADASTETPVSAA